MNKTRVKSSLILSMYNSKLQLVSYEVKLEKLILDPTENYVIELDDSGLSREEFIMSVVWQTKHLRLLKDKSVYHLRLDTDLNHSVYLKEKVIGEYLISIYPMLFDDRLTSWRTGDINRLLVAEGSNLN